MIIDFIKTFDFTDENKIKKEPLGYIGCKDIVDLTVEMLHKFPLIDEHDALIREYISHCIKNISIEKSFGPISYGKKKPLKSLRNLDTDKKNINIVTESLIANILIYRKEVGYFNNLMGGIVTEKNRLSDNDFKKIYICFDWAIDWIVRELYLWQDDWKDIKRIKGNPVSKTKSS